MVGVPIGSQQNVARKFTNGDHVGHFLELERLLIYKRTLVVDNNIWINWAVRLVVPFPWSRDQYGSAIDQQKRTRRRFEGAGYQRNQG